MPAPRRRSFSPTSAARGRRAQGSSAAISRRAARMPANASRAGCHGALTVGERVSVDERKARRQELVQPRAVDPRIQEGELLTRRPRDAPAPGDDRIPRRVLEDEPDHQQDVLELRRRDAELAVADRRVEEGVFERYAVVLGEVVADDQLVVRVQVHEPVGLARRSRSSRGRREAPSTDSTPA